MKEFWEEVKQCIIGFLIIVAILIAIYAIVRWG